MTAALFLQLQPFVRPYASNYEVASVWIMGSRYCEVTSALKKGGKTWAGEMPSLRFLCLAVSASQGIPAAPAWSTLPAAPSCWSGLWGAGRDLFVSHSCQKWSVAKALGCTQNIGRSCWGDARFVITTIPFPYMASSYFKKSLEAVLAYFIWADWSIW